MVLRRNNKEYPRVRHPRLDQGSVCISPYMNNNVRIIDQVEDDDLCEEM